MYGSIALVLFAAVLSAQDRSDWQAVSQLHIGDQVKLSLKGQASVTGPFQTWTPEQITVGAATANRQDVARVERIRPGAWSRGKTALVGAGIGGATGIVFGAVSGGCNNQGFAPCPVTRGQVTAVIGVIGALLGAGVGAVLPHHRTDLLYRAK